MPLYRKHVVEIAEEATAFMLRDVSLLDSMRGFTDRNTKSPEEATIAASHVSPHHLCSWQYTNLDAQENEGWRHPKQSARKMGAFIPRFQNTEFGTSLSYTIARENLFGSCNAWVYLTDYTVAFATRNVYCDVCDTRLKLEGSVRQTRTALVRRVILHSLCFALRA